MVSYKKLGTEYLEHYSDMGFHNDINQHKKLNTLWNKVSTSVSDLLETFPESSLVCDTRLFNKYL